MAVTQEQSQDHFESSEFPFSDLIHWVVFVYYSADCVFRFYLSRKQYAAWIQPVEKIPPVLQNHVDQETLKKARRSAMDKGYMDMFLHIWPTVVTLAVLHFQLIHKTWLLTNPMILSWMPIHWVQETFRSMAYGFFVVFFYLAASLPITVYSAFFIENRHVFKKRQTVFEFVLEYLVTSLVLSVLMSAMAGLIFVVVQAGGQHLFPSLLVASIVLKTLVDVYYPMLLWRFNCKPLPEGRLRDQLISLAERVEFHTTKILIDYGNYLTNSTSPVSCRRGRIVININLLLKTKPSEQSGSETSQENGVSLNAMEIEALVAQNLAYWKWSYNLKSFAFSTIIKIVMCTLVTFLYRNPVVYKAFGFLNPEELSILPGLLMCYLLTGGSSKIYDYLVELPHRRFEFQTDAFAVKLGYAWPLRNVFVKVIKFEAENLANDMFYDVVNGWQPSTLFQRLEAIEKFCVGLEATESIKYE